MLNLVETGILATGAKYWVEVTEEEQEPGRGCVFCGRCVEACTHNLKSPESNHGVFKMEEIYYDSDLNRVELEKTDKIKLNRKIC